MSAEVIPLRVDTLLEVPAQKILQGAIEQDLACVLVLGFDADGELYAASSAASRATNVHLVEAFKHALLSGAYGEAQVIRPGS